MGVFVVGESDVGHLGEQVLGGVGEQFLDACLPGESAGAGGGDESIADDPGQRVLGISGDGSSDREISRMSQRKDSIGMLWGTGAGVVLEPVLVGDGAEAQVLDTGAATIQPEAHKSCGGNGKRPRPALTVLTNTSSGAPVFGTPISTTRRTFEVHRRSKGRCRPRGEPSARTGRRTARRDRPSCAR